MRCKTFIAAIVVLGFLMVPESPAQKGAGSKRSSSTSDLKTVHVKGHMRNGHYVQPHMRSAPGTARTGARTTARTEPRMAVPVPLPIVTSTGPTPASGGTAVSRDAVTSTQVPDDPAQAEPPAPTFSATPVHPTSSPAAPMPAIESKETNDEVMAARLLTLAVSVEAAAKEAKTKRETARLLESAERRYTEVVQKFPKTNAAGEARNAIKRLQKR